MQNLQKKIVKINLKYDFMKNKFISKNLKDLFNMLPISKIRLNKDEISIYINKSDILFCLFFLKNNTQYQFKILSHISGIDYPNKKNRFVLVYELLSVRFNTRIRIKTTTNEIEPIDSIESIYLAANWFESETWDMYGIFFLNHSNLTRLLTDYGFEGYPLRKDFPLTGFVETSYDYKRKRIIQEKVELSQEFRAFKFNSPWNSIEIKN